jgi:hypothetical protein
MRPVELPWNHGLAIGAVTAEHIDNEGEGL